jgi:dsRNA-specific ribonuclease
MRLDDYERLEFLGDSILNYMVAKHFFLSSQNDAQRKMPKELHKMKTAVINNALLSLIVIEKGLDKFIIYNKKAESFKSQFDKFVATVKQALGSTSTLQISELPKE